MNEIDPANNSNGSISGIENLQSSNNKNTSLLSSLLASSAPSSVIKFKHDVSSPISKNGQQTPTEKVSEDDLMMSSSSSSSFSGRGNTSTIVSNAHCENNISPKGLSVSAKNLEASTVLKEFEIDKGSNTNKSNSHKSIFNNLNEILQSNNNNSETTPTKSILENCLLKPSSLKSSIFSNRLESHQYLHHHNFKSQQNIMEETESTAAATPLIISKFTQSTEENRRVEPLKINLNREPIRTIIKLPTNNVYDSPTKITKKSPQPPLPPPSSLNVSTTEKSSSVTLNVQSISPTLSSSSSLSSESSYDNYNDRFNTAINTTTSIQVVPKLHLRSLLDTPNDQSELHIVPKLTITGLNSSQTSSTLSQKREGEVEGEEKCHQQNSSSATVRDQLSVNNMLESQTIPKLTIKKDNNSSNESFYHLNNEPNAIPKLHIKTNFYHHHNHQQQQQSTPTVPKLTIKTTENDTLTVVSSLSHDSEQQQTPTVIPKITIKPLIRPLPSPVDEEDEEEDEIQGLMKDQKVSQEESIPKLTLKAVHNNNASDSLTFEKVVPKLVVKLSKDTSFNAQEEESLSTTSSIPSTIKKLNIKPLPLSEKEVPMQHQQLTISSTDFNSTSSQENVAQFFKDEEEINLKSKPLEINTNIIKGAESGLDSPRIILKINKTNNESLKTEIIQNQPQQQQTNASKVINNNKRAHDAVNDKNDDENDNSDEMIDEKKKIKLDESKEIEADVIVINDSDASNEASGNLNNKNSIEASCHPTHHLNLQENDSINNKSDQTKTTRSLRQSRRQHESKLATKTPYKNTTVENTTVTTVDPLAITDSLSNSVLTDEIVTPKRGRGRPKKIIQVTNEKSLKSLCLESRDPLEISEASVADEGNDQNTNVNNDEKTQSFACLSVEDKRTPTRGRGRGRGRLKRTIEVIKNGKSIQITLEGHDDDDSPSFSLYNRNSLRGGFSKRSKGGKSGRGGGVGCKTPSKASPFVTPERSKDGTFTFTSPSFNSDFDINRKKIFNTPSIFEEDTRMSIGGGESHTPVRTFEMHSNEESQSSILSSTSNTVEGSVKKRSKKMEVCEPEGRTEFTIDMLAEYDWPQNEPPKSRDSFMIQEQIAEYLGIKSFKRKYPDLMRRPVDMEERNFLFESGLASEKMCDLGLTAVYANEILDIMCNDYPEKYEEYKRYQREKAFRNARLRLETAVVDRSQMQKDKAISSASDWNTRFNKDRRENRRCYMDLQNFLIQKPTPVRDYKIKPAADYRSAYPAALVPGQFSEFYEKYTPEQLACYPINTILVDFKKLEQYMAKHPSLYEFSDDDSGSESDSSDNSNYNSDDVNSSKDTSSSSDSNSDIESSSDDDDRYEDPKCRVCTQTPYTNRFNQPEKFIKCSSCKHHAHPSCIEMTQQMYTRSLAYNWQCSNCKKCGKCEKQKDNKMLFCIQCDRGYHIYCLGLRNVPEGQYHCVNCTVCSECGAKSPEGHFNAALTQQQRQDLAMIAQWNHEFTKNPLTNIREHKKSLCLPCYRKIN